jgi:pilus assembly protein Flp/PilA
VRKLLANRRGATAIEYAIMAAMIALVLFTAVGGVGNKTLANFEKVRAGFN